MASSGRIFKWCSCRDALTGRRLEKACPRPAQCGHGMWYFHCSATNLLGGSERVRKGRFLSHAAASRARRKHRKKIKHNARKSRPVTPKKSAAPGLPAKTHEPETAAHRPRHGTAGQRKRSGTATTQTSHRPST
jgi:hypothetical protein